MLTINDIDYCNARLRTGMLQTENGLLVPLERQRWFGKPEVEAYVAATFLKAMTRVNLALLEGRARFAAITNSPVSQIVLVREEDNDATVKVENYCVTETDLDKALNWANAHLSRSDGDLNIVPRGDSVSFVDLRQGAHISPYRKNSIRLINKALLAGALVWNGPSFDPYIIAAPAKEQELPKVGAAVHYWPADDDQYLLKSMGPFAAIVAYVTGLQVHLHVMASPLQTKPGTDPSKLQFFRKCQWGTPSVEWIS